MEASQRALLDTAAARFAERLDRDMAARWRDMQLAAALPPMRDPTTPPATRREILRQLHDTDADYALIAFIGPDSRVVADSRSLTEGQDAAAGPLLRAAMQGPVVQDVHDAAVPGAGAPLRRIDLAAPVRGADGRLLGVITAHLDWRWAAAQIGAPRP
ncbi:MAG: cache domain-containing protein, partial [Paracraurococcus sp.]